MCMSIEKWHLDAKANGIGYKVLRLSGRSIYHDAKWAKGKWVEARLGSHSSLRLFDLMWGSLGPIDPEYAGPNPNKLVWSVDRHDNGTVSVARRAGPYSLLDVQPQGIYVLPTVETARSYLQVALPYGMDAKVAAFEWDTLIAAGTQFGLDMFTVQFAKFIEWVQ